jgi:exopolyphosphatase/guanosine-5'-triphosphate,3'-diphosphate pyrophosphatase
VHLAAIDIGSNGARLLISAVLFKKQKPYLKPVEYVRFPLRLGEDVFTHQRISLQRIDQMLKLLESFKLLMELYEVTDSLVFATAAMREAKNGEEVIQKIKSVLGLDMQIISGDQEAEFTNYTLAEFVKKGSNYIHIDVGGGSTEINLFQDEKKLFSRSYKVGSVRNAQAPEYQQLLVDMKHWINQKVASFVKQETIAIGTGGNINKIYKLLDRKISRPIKFEEIKTIKEYLEEFTLEERVHKLGLNPDRADTIVPAGHIYLLAMETAHAKQMIVPNLGLKDGILAYLLEKNMAKISTYKAQVF